MLYNILSKYIADHSSGLEYQNISIVETGTARGYSALCMAKILSDAGLNKGVALSMQSLDPQTLKAIKRDNISLDTYLELATRFSRDKVETFSDIILGNPEETYDTLV